ncbi:kinase-like protein [Gigaspora margarita]|uniref:Kinase-like protein n=1 Tax=Gigaspora margarita TaxID=4874 RepID=A0A8H4B1N7_GIGMA|nr:kinase-like protein [Gigaspora margarita]
MEDTWLETAITDDHIKFIEYKEFTDCTIIGTGGFGVVSKYKWKSCALTVALKHVKDADINLDKRGFINELKLLRKVCIHPNIIAFYGITKVKQTTMGVITWFYNLLMVEICENTWDFGLSKQTDEASITSNSAILGMPAYMEPKCFDTLGYKRDKKSDIYSFGVILWEISSGRPPFQSISHVMMIGVISKGTKEDSIKGTPAQYVALYRQCWNTDPPNHPESNSILKTLNQLIADDVDFKLHPGFTINLPSNVKKELENNGDSSLTPMVIESVYNQAFITRKRIKPDFTMRKLNKHIRNELELRFIKTSMKDPNIQIESSVVEHINNKYPDIQQKIELVVIISSDSWKKLKHRYFFAKLITTKIYKATCSENKEEIGHSTIKLLNSIFMGEEEDVHKIIQKYTEAQRGRGIIYAFFCEYSKWRSECFIPHVKKLLPSPLGLDKQIDCKFDEKFKLLKRELKKREFEKICKKIEEKYSTGRKFKIIDIIESYLFSSSFHFIYETETTQPDQLQITIYETLLEESDLFELQKNELYVPKPKLFTNNDGVAEIYFQINSGVYELSEELCFVEVGGRARIYNLLNCQFRPGIGQFPANAASIMSTPDGLCIIAFVKETLKIEQPFEDDNVEPYSSIINTNINEKYYAYIYFCTSFERPDAKVIEIPLDMQFFEYFQFSLIHKQIHLTTLDLENGLFFSSIVKITKSYS